MKRAVLIAAVIPCLLFQASAQNYPEGWEEYISAGYYYSLKQEKNSASLPEAECLERLLAAARSDLAQQMEINVSRSVSMTDLDTGGHTESIYSATSNFSSDVTLRFVETRTHYDRKKKTGYALAFISKEELEEIYQARGRKISAMLDIAKNAVKELKIDAALKYCYWAILLNATLPVQYQTDYCGTSVQWWARNQMESILSALSFVYVGRTEDDQLLGMLDITMDGKPVTSLDYTYNDGLGQSARQQARDGVGTIEFRANIDIRNIDVKVEYAYEDESVSDPEIRLAMKEVSPIRFAGALKTGVSVRERQQEKRSSKKRTSQSSAPVTAASSQLAREVAGEFSAVSLSAVNDTLLYMGELNKVLDAIQNRNYDSCRDLFTAEGYDIFERLVRYGNAKILKRGPLSFASYDGTVFCRSIPMKFSFQNNYKSFLENVVFAFGQDGKISSIAFALESESIQGILSKTKWDDSAKIALINFLENYKTAFALKNLEYISSIFSDDALIITGRKVKRTVREGGVQLSGEAFEYNRQTKTQYISNLRRGFASKEYINLKFSNVSVLKTTRGPNPNFYGIQVRQDYFSSNYGDSGYLYLLVDISDQDAPLIHVRTWQPEPDPEFGIYGIGNL